MKEPLYKVLALLVDARLRCLEGQQDRDESSKAYWMEMAYRHKQDIADLVKDYMPSGSGFDGGTTIDFGGSTGDRLVFETAFHHMDDGGSYDGWTEHRVTVRSSLMFDFTLTVSGKNRNGIKDLIHEVFHAALETEIDKSVPVRAQAEG